MTTNLKLVLTLKHIRIARKVSSLSYIFLQGEKFAYIVGVGSEKVLEVYQPRISVKFTQVPGHVVKFYRIYIFQINLFELLVLV